MKYIKVEQFKDKDVIALTTTLQFGNMAYQIPDDINKIKERRKELAKDINIEEKNIIFVHQTHSDILQYVDKNDAGRGMNDFNDGVEADALYTDKKDVALAIFHADCAPIFVYVKKIPLVMIIHAGYKGTLKHITYKSITKIKEKYHLSGTDFQVVIGPTRNFIDFHIDNVSKEEIYKANLEKAVRLNGENDALYDLPFANIIDLVDAGIPLTNIVDEDINTVDDSNCFSCFNKTKNKGRMVSLIMLK